MGDSLVRALNGVDLEIRKGDFLAIVGSSGSGKSTLMHALGLMDTLTSGTLHVNEQETSKLNSAQRATLRSQEIGFVFQTFNLLPRLTIENNVLLPAQYSRRAHPAKLPDAIAVLERVGMAHRIGHKPNELSGGERQRVSIARALINKPSLILADEPTGNLDSQNMVNILKLFTDLNAEGQTIIIVTHDPDVAKNARNFIRMRDGQIIETDLKR